MSEYNNDRLIELEATLEEANSLAHSRALTIERLEAENAALRQQREVLEQDHIILSAQVIELDFCRDMASKAEDRERALIAERDALKAEAERYKRMRAATYSHVDQRDLLAELKPGGWHFCNIKVQVRINGEWREHEGDWLRKLWHARDRDAGPYVESLNKEVEALDKAHAAIDAARRAGA